MKALASYLKVIAILWICYLLLKQKILILTLNKIAKKVNSFCLYVQIQQFLKFKKNKKIILLHLPTIFVSNQTDMKIGKIEETHLPEIHGMLFESEWQPILASQPGNLWVELEPQ